MRFSGSVSSDYTYIQLYNHRVLMSRRCTHYWCPGRYSVPHVLYLSKPGHAWIPDIQSGHLRQLFRFGLTACWRIFRIHKQGLEAKGIRPVLSIGRSQYETETNLDVVCLPFSLHPSDSGLDVQGMARLRPYLQALGSQLEGSVEYDSVHRFAQEQI